MITPQEIKKKAEGKYVSYLQSLIANTPFEKLVIRGDKKYTKSSLPEFEKEIQLIVSQSKEKKGFGYTLEFQQVKTKYLGTQDLPASIYFDTGKDFLKFLGKEKEVELFFGSVKKIIEAFPELEDWIFKNPTKVILNHTNWESILKVCQYFNQNPKPNLYLRELPINVHTKFIEKNQSVIKDLLEVLISDHISVKEKQFEKRFNLKYAEPQIRFKILDLEISQRFFSGLNDIAIPISQFETLSLPIRKVLVVENKTTLYTTLTLPKMDKAIAIFGSGYKISDLKNASWLADKEIYYWGDIDTHGFDILSQIRGYFKETKSIMMDVETLNFFREDWGKGEPIKKNSLPNLTPEEEGLFKFVRADNVNTIRLEQEKIPFDYVNKYFDKG